MHLDEPDLQNGSQPSSEKPLPGSENTQNGGAIPSNGSPSAEPIRLVNDETKEVRFLDGNANMKSAHLPPTNDDNDKPRRSSRKNIIGGNSVDLLYTAELESDSDAISGDDPEETASSIRRRYRRTLFSGYSQKEERDRFLCMHFDVFGDLRSKARVPVLQRHKYIEALENQLVSLAEEVEKLKREKGEMKSKLREFKGLQNPQLTEEYMESDDEKEAEEVAAPMYGPCLDYIPGVARRTWDQWVDPYHSEAPYHVVEILVEKPRSFLSYQVPYFLRRQFGKSEISIPSDNRVDVERIRLNSGHLHVIFKSMFGEATAPSDNSVFLRPFKLFVCYEEALRELLTNIRNRLEYPMYGPVPKPASNSSKASLNEAVDAEAPYEENSEESGVSEDQGTSTSSVHPPNSDPGAALEVSHAMAEHLDAMLRFTDVELKQYRAIFRRLRSREAETVDFKDLWFLFAPGDKIYHSETKQAYQVLAVSGGRSLLTKNLEDLESDEPAFTWSSPTAETEITSPFVIDCIYLDFNGEELGPVNHQVTIMPYTGSQDISSLEFLPLEYAKTIIDMEKNTEVPLEDYLVKRGKKYLDLLDSQEVPHREYIGFSVGENREQIDSRVIIDLSLYWEKNIEKRPVLGLRRPGEADVREVAEMNTCSCYSCRSEGKRRNSHIYDDRKVDRQRMEAFIAENSDTWRLIRDPKGKVKHDLLCLLPSRVFGYVLRSRKWHQLDMDRTSPVKQRAQNFNDLILPTDYKDLVEGMVRTHARGSKPSISISNEASAIHGTDLVRGKGKGVIILLHGVPGVGKTSTAECVAEYTLRPLFSITCGDIGEDAKTVEANLEENFQLAHRWGCVLLLDEADVFLQTRNKSDMARNAVVSVFLRILEYYSGILFLTTNKVGTFDDAFTSRIHLSLYYPPLDRKQTKKIWKVNLDRIQRTNQGTLVVQKDEIMQWVKELMGELNSRDFRPWNGRQIHNACQTATSIAKFRPKEKGVLGPGEFETVKNATFDFDDYLKNVHGMDDAGRAKRNFDRNDFWGDEPYYGGASTKQRPSSYGRRRNVDYGDQGRGKGRKRISRDDRKRYDGDSGSDEVRERRKSRKDKDSDSDSDSDS